MFIAVGLAGCGQTEGSEGSGPPAAEERAPAAADGRPVEVAEAPAHRIEHPVFDLGANRLLAHALVRGGGLRIDAGSASLVRYLRIGGAVKRWSPGVVRDGVRAADPPSVTSLLVPLAEDQAGATAIHLRVHARAGDRVQVGAGGRSVAVTTSDGGWQTLSFPLGPGRLRPGINELGLQTSDRVAVAWVQVGGDVQAAVPRWIDGAFELPEQGGLAWYVQVPEDAELVGAIGGPGCRVQVSATAHQAEPVRGILAGDDGRVALGALAGRAARLELVATGCANARLTGVAITIPGPTPEVRRGQPPRHIVWWVMDTLRGDRTRTVNPSAVAEIPNLQRLADRGAAFRQFYTQGNESQTSHASFWTAQFPANHKVVTAGSRTNYQLSSRLPQLGPRMRDTGRRTIGVTSNGNVEQWTGYTRGFDEFENLMEDGTHLRYHWRVPAREVVDRTLRHLKDVSRPFFLFMGTTDTHKPWYGRQPWLDRYHPEPYRGPFDDRVLPSALGIPHGTHDCLAEISPKDMKRILAIYDSSISYQDDQLGRFLRELDARGIADQTMIIVTADHGEELWEYPRTCGHGSSLRESLVHVPLVIHYPPLIPPAVVDEGVDGVDILPTILDALGEPPMPSAQGESLLPLVHGVGRGYVRPSYASMNEFSHTLRLGRWKGTIGRRGIVALYDVEADPSERTDLAGSRPIERQLINDALLLFVANRAAWKKREWGVPSNMSATAAGALEAR